MKKNITLILIVIAFLIVGGVGFYLFENGKLPGFKSTEQVEPKINLEDKSNILNKDNFSLEMPDGWVEVANPQSALLTAVDTKEIITDTNAQKINFRSYFSVIPDTLGEQSKDSFYQTVKDSLNEAISDISFTHEGKAVVDNKDNYFLEAEFNQQEIDFKILLPINIGEKDVWIMSFNTLKSSWDNYKDVFYNTAKSLKVKQI